ncbi:MAG: hcl 1 [Bradyrhizobium sp.]|nr:hcl 1 [Bradyrhizobium sp.]
MRLYDLTTPEDRVVGKVLSEQARHLPDRVWLAGDDLRVTFAEADRIVNRYAHALIEAGIAPREPVAMVVEPSVDALLVAMAVTRVGGLFTTINTDYHTAFLEEALLQTAARVLVIDAALLPRLDALASLALVERVVVIGEAPAIRAIAHTPLAAWSDYPDAPVEERSGWLDPVQCWWSSGTTGKPKGIVQSHSSVLMQVNCYDREFLPGEILYSCTPFYLGSPWSGIVWPSLLYGFTAAIDARFSVRRFWDRIRHYQATQAFTLGAMHILLWKQPPSERDTDNSLRRYLAIPMPSDLLPKFKKRFGIGAMSQGYGTSETFRIFDSPDLNQDRSGALLGAPLPHYDVALLDPQDKHVPDGVAGEICVRPREPGRLFLGYFRDPQRTLDAWSGLWHHTGDMAVRHEDGLYYFADRKKDYIRYKGRNISMFEVEAVIDEIDAVADVAAYGITSEELESESELMVAVVRRPGATLSAEQVARFVNERAPYFFVPRYVVFIDEMPRNAHGRIQKEDLRAQGVTTTTWDREASDFEVVRA